MENQEYLLKELCIELRHVGCALGWNPNNAKLTKEFIDHIGEVKSLAKILKENQINPTSRLADLTQQTGWNMNKLYHVCLEFPKKTPTVKDIKEKIIKPKNNYQNKTLRFFGQLGDSWVAKTYINQREVKLFLEDDYMQVYSQAMVDRINTHLGHLEKGVKNALIAIRNIKETDESYKVIEAYLQYCNRYFTKGQKLITFNSEEITEECLLSKLRVAAVWVFVDDSEIEFLYEVMFWDKLLENAISVIEDDNHAVVKLEIERNVDWQAYEEI